MTKTSIKRKAISKKESAIQTATGVLLEARLRDSEVREKIWDKKWDDVPDAEDTVEQVRRFEKITEKDPRSHLPLKTILREGLDKSGYKLVIGGIKVVCDHHLKIIEMRSNTNYWKYTCITILLGVVVGMVSLTPSIIKMCTN